MTKARARQRAKARAAKQAGKPAAAADQPVQKTRPGKFDPGPGSIKGPFAKANTRSFTTMKRGAARSR